MLKIVLIIALAAVGVFALLFTVYFFNLDMKLMVNIVAPFFEKHYDRMERKQYL